MTIWAVGAPGNRARFIESNDPANILGNMAPGEECAPVSKADKERGGLLLGAMEFRVFTDAELLELDQ